MGPHAIKHRRSRATKRRSLDCLIATQLMSQEQIVALAIGLLAGSEVLSLLPGVRANGWLQLVFSVLRAVAAHKPR